MNYGERMNPNQSCTYLLNQKDRYKSSESSLCCLRDSDRLKSDRIKVKKGLFNIKREVNCEWYV